MITLTDIRNAADRLYQGQKYNIHHKYSTVSHRDGTTSKTGVKIYTMDEINYFPGKVLYQKLSAAADKLGR